MKQGSGEDPFADHEDDDEEVASEAAESEGVAAESDSAVEPSGSGVESGAGADSSDTTDPSTGERYTDSGAGSRSERAGGTGGSGDETAGDAGSGSTDADGADGQTKAEADGIPWVLRRSRVKEDRGNVHQFFLREEYSAREDEIIEAVAGELDMRQKDLQKLDVREAMVAAADPEDVAEVLREWGYEYLK